MKGTQVEPDFERAKAVLIPLATVGLALAATSGFWGWFQPTPWALFYAAVMTSAWCSGFFAGTLASVGSAIAANLALPLWPGASATQGFFSTAVFLGVTHFIVFLSASRRRAVEHERHERRRFETTMRSIGDAVVATDARGRVTFMNPVAEELTGWPGAEGVGRPLDDVFPIFNEDTRTPTPSPVRKVMETGRVQGLANHTILVARDGAERPIDDSAAPIVDDEGRMTGVVLVFHDVATKRESERTLAASEELSRRILDGSPDCLKVLDADGRILSINPAGRKLLELDDDAPDPTGRWIDFWPESERAPASEAIEAARAGRVSTFFARLPTFRGTRKLWEITTSPVLDASRKVDRLLVVSRDVTERKRAEEALRENDRRKDEFLAMLAHELRNPLAAVDNAVTVMKFSNAPEHLSFAKDVIARQLKHLTRLIDDLLDVSRISRGKIELRKDVVEAASILLNAAKSVKPLVDERKHELDVDLGSEKLWVDVDATRLEQVILNLLNNAAKYSDKPGRIRLTARREGSDVVVRVEDEGVGIPRERLAQVFDLFVQGDRSLARSEGGLGIGLTVVKKLVELHGGSVTADSPGPGAGSVFTIRLPAAEPNERPESDRPRAEAAGRRTRVLVVDDNVDTLRGMATLLALLGHDAFTAENGPEALAAARRHHPEVVLLDIGLPGMNGYEVAERLRAMDCCARSLIVAVSGYGRQEDRRRSREAGFDHHLIKPLNQDALISLLADGTVGGA